MSEARSGLFPLGRRVATRNALAVLGEAGMRPDLLFDRHATGDWGTIEGKSWYLNRMAIDCGYGCVASVYRVLGDIRVVVLTGPKEHPHSPPRRDRRALKGRDFSVTEAEMVMNILTGGLLRVGDFLPAATRPL